MIKVDFYGHAFCRVTTTGGLRVATDPYNPEAVDYPFPSVEADVVTVSHDHSDHNYADGILGNPVVLKEAEEKKIQGVSFKGIPTYHDKKQGKELGPNIVWVIKDDKISVVHLGDLGHMLTLKQVEEIGKVDILLATVGGTWTIGPKEASRIMDLLNAKIVIPVHYWTPMIVFPLAPLYEFLKDKENVGSSDYNFVEIDENQLPEQTQIIPVPYK